MLSYEVLHLTVVFNAVYKPGHRNYIPLMLPSLTLHVKNSRGHLERNCEKAEMTRCPFAEALK